jgi:hypothetical protein
VQKNKQCRQQTKEEKYISCDKHKIKDLDRDKPEKEKEKGKLVCCTNNLYMYYCLNMFSSISMEGKVRGK